MTKETHSDGGLLAGLMTVPVLLNSSNIELSGVDTIKVLCIYLFAAYFGGLLPDIDMKGSYVSKSMPIVYILFGKKHKHRGFTHSILAIVIMLVGSIVLTYLSGKDMVIAAFLFGLTVGCLSHIVLDLLTIDGVKLFYPSNKDISFYNIKTSSKREKKFRNFLKIAIWIFLGFNIHIILK